MRNVWIALLLGSVSLYACSQSPAENSTLVQQQVQDAYLKATSGIDAPTIRADAVLSHLQDGSLILVDVRQETEMAVSQIPGALSLDEFKQKYQANGPPKDKTVVAYCTIGYRSGKFAEKLTAQGIAVRNLEGGILAWVGSHGPLVHSDSAGVTAATTTVHVYGKEWNLLPPGYQGVW